MSNLISIALFLLCLALWLEIQSRSIERSNMKKREAGLLDHIGYLQEELNAAIRALELKDTKL